jgi:hypothetical protein
MDENIIVNNLDINIYPNPTSEYFFINFTNLEGKTYSISIFDMVGKIVKKLDYQSQESELQVNSSDIPKGVYFLIIKDDQKSLAKKLVIH